MMPKIRRANTMLEMNYKYQNHQYVIYVSDEAIAQGKHLRASFSWNKPGVMTMKVKDKEFNVVFPLFKISEKQAAMWAARNIFLMAASGYDGHTNVCKQIIRNTNRNKFNPINIEKKDGKTFLVEYHSRAGYFKIHEARQYDWNKFTTKLWKYDRHCNEYEYAGEI
jgi:hypothetical protein